MSIEAAHLHDREVLEALGELFQVIELVGHEEVQQAPELLHVVLERGSRDQQAVRRAEVVQGLVQLRVLVLQAVGLVALSWGVGTRHQ